MSPVSDRASLYELREREGEWRREKGTHQVCPLDRRQVVRHLAESVSPGLEVLVE